MKPYPQAKYEVLDRLSKRLLETRCSPSELAYELDREEHFISSIMFMEPDIPLLTALLEFERELNE
jgi:hypothetical protein